MYSRNEIKRSATIFSNMAIGILMGLSATVSGYAQTNADPQSPNMQNTSPMQANKLQMFEEYFQGRLTKELAAIGVDQNTVAAERKIILAEQDEKHALALASDFNAKYRPLYVRALQNMKLSQTTIDNLTNVPQLPDLDGYLEIIHVSYRCNALSLDLCNAVYPSGCYFQRITAGAFVFPTPVSQHTDRYTLETSGNGVLNMWKSNIDGKLIGQIGSIFYAYPSTDQVCIQTRGHLEAFAVSTYLDSYLNSHADSGASLQMGVAPFSTSPNLQNLLNSVLNQSDRSHLNVAVGDEYLAERHESAGELGLAIPPLPPEDRAYWGYSWFDLSGPSHNGLAGSNLPYPIEDQVWVSPNGPSLMQVYYEANLSQSYRWGEVAGRIRFVLDEIDVLQVPGL